MQKTTFKIPKMDCPSEEQLIRLKLIGMKDIHSMHFDLQDRSLQVIHEGSHEPVLKELELLRLDASLVSSARTEAIPEVSDPRLERKVLWIVLIINFTFFVIELVAGLISGSMGLVADSLDMLADSFVYALALMVVGGTLARKKRVAGITGYIQFFLALVGFAEIIRRFIGTSEIPDYRTMIVVSSAALVANIFCLYLLQKSRSREAHMQASMIFTSNDIIINSGVIAAGLLVNWLNSDYPDLVIGAIVFVIVARGAWRILRLSR